MSSYFLMVFDLPEGKLLEYLIDLKRSVEKKRLHYMSSVCL